MPVGKEEIRNRWGFHAGTDDTIPKHNRVREAFIAFAEFLDEVLPDGHAKDLAFDKLQETSMWSNFGVAELAPLVQRKPNSVKTPADVAALRPSAPAASTRQ